MYMKDILNVKKAGSIFLLALIALSCKKTLDHPIGDGTPGDGALVPDITVDTSIKKIDVSKYAQARVFPGLVCATEPRLNNVHVLMNLNYNYVESNLHQSVPPQPLFSTGLYAAPGELVIIDVPGNYSLAVQIGAWTDNLSSVVNAPRDPVIFSKMQLAPGRNYIRNLYGGHIYINAARPVANPVDLVFTNVVKSPDFILGVTSNADWQAAINNSCVPWLELRSKNMIFTVPRDYCVAHPIADPTALMQEWDDAINLDYYQWEGLSATPADSFDLAPLLPWRVVQDIKPVVGYGHSGYPVVTQNDYGWFNEFTDITQIRGGGCWGTLHELGHNNQQTRYWSWTSLGETSNNLFSFKVAHRHETTNPAAWPPSHPALPTDFPKALDFADAPGTKNFDGSDSRINTPFARLVPFVQIFDKVKANKFYPGQPGGWEFMGFLYSKARHATRISQNDQDCRDFFFEAICDFTHVNWIYFFNAWGIQVSNISSNKMKLKYPVVMNQKIWEYNPLTRTGGDDTFSTDPYDRSNWSITASSEEALGSEPDPSGPAQAAIDGDINSYWHSDYDVFQPFPYTLTIDMGSSLPINGFKIIQRQMQRRDIKNIKIETSTNGTSWTVVSGSPFALAQSDALQELTIPLTTCRYFRLSVLSAADLYDTDCPCACLAEIDVKHP